MRDNGASLWKLSHAQLAQRCEEIGFDNSSKLEPAVREEAKRLYGAWMIALAIDEHQDGTAGRQADIADALRKRTIEVLIKIAEATEA